MKAEKVRENFRPTLKFDESGKGYDPIVKTKLNKSEAKVWGPNREPASADDIIIFVKQQLDSVKAPKMVHITDNLPRSTVGKVLRRAAKDLFG